MTAPYCVICERWMVPVRTPSGTPKYGIHVRDGEILYNGDPYYCPVCDSHVLTNFGEPAEVEATPAALKQEAWYLKEAKNH